MCLESPVWLQVAFMEAVPGPGEVKPCAVLVEHLWEGFCLNASEHKTHHLNHPWSNPALSAR